MGGVEDEGEAGAASQQAVGRAEAQAGRQAGRQLMRRRPLRSHPGPPYPPSSPSPGPPRPHPAPHRVVCAGHVCPGFNAGIREFGGHPLLIWHPRHGGGCPPAPLNSIPRGEEQAGEEQAGAVQWLRLGRAHVRRLSGVVRGHPPSTQHCCGSAPPPSNHPHNLTRSAACMHARTHARMQCMHHAAPPRLPVGEAQGLVKGLCIANHLLQRLPAVVVVGRGDHKLLHLLKLVHPAGGWGREQRNKDVTAGRRVSAGAGGGCSQARSSREGARAGTATLLAAG